MDTARSAGGQHAGDVRDVKKVAFASFIGTTIEWYDFFLYGTAAALVFGELFFPKAEPAVGTLAAFATYAVGFAARPLGGLVFGHYGDRVGRKTMLVLALMIMGTATFLIGCLPTFDSIGILAPILLVVLRFMQGIGVGGEWGGAVLMSVEHAPEGKRGFFGSWPQMGVPAGLLLSTSVFAAVRGLTDEATFSAWAWRVPFLLSIVLVGVGLIIRMKLAESPMFEKVRKSETTSRKPIVDVIKEQPRDVLTAMGMRMAENGIFYVYTVFFLAYGEDTLKLSEETMLIGVAIVAAIGLFTIPFYGRLSDRVGRKPLYMTGAIVSLLMCFPAFALANTESAILIWLAMIIGVNIGHDLMYGPQGAYFAELFGTKHRYSGASLGYQLASVFAGGFAPLIAAALLTAGGDKPWLVAAYMSGLAIITIVATAFARETYRDRIDDEPAIEPTRRFEREPVRETEPVR